MRKNRSNLVNEKISEITISPELKAKVMTLINNYKQQDPGLIEEIANEVLYIPVENGEVKVFHIKPENPTTKRPILFMPGWGNTTINFIDVYEILYNRAEFYYFETREKGSSKLNRWKANMTLSQKAKDLVKVIKYLELDKKDFILYGACWGGTIILQGLIDGTLTAPTIVTQDPMHYFWYNNFLIRVFGRIIPPFLIQLFKPILKHFALKGMTQKRQLERLDAAIADAIPWKWRKAALANLYFEHFGKLLTIKEEVFIFNGTEDKIHDNSNYPKMAQEIPKGRFFYMEVDEDQREYLMGTILLEFAKVTKNNDPENLLIFEKSLIKKSNLISNSKN